MKAKSILAEEYNFTVMENVKKKYTRNSVNKRRTQQIRKENNYLIR